MKQYMKNPNKKQSDMSFGHNPYSDAIDVSYMPVKAGTYYADLFGEIYSPTQFSNIIQCLNMMEENDCFELQLNSCGGSVDAGDTLIHAINGCKGHVHMVASGSADSMASCILLQADSFELSEGFSSLIHAGSMGFGSHYQEYKQYAEFSINATEKSIRRIYQGFLSEAEIQSVLDGKPIVVDADGWVERHEKRNEYINRQIEDFKEQAKQVEEEMSKRDTVSLSHITGFTTK